jgi:hypothetical protein
VGDRGQPFRLFRHNEGNFYTAVIYSLKKLARGEGKTEGVAPPAPARLLDLRRPGSPDSGGTLPR